MRALAEYLSEAVLIDDLGEAKMGFLYDLKKFSVQDDEYKYICS